MMVTKDRQFPLSTPLSTMITIFFIWFITGVVSSPPLFGWGQFGLNTLGVRYFQVLETGDLGTRLDIWMILKQRKTVHVMDLY